MAGHRVDKTHTHPVQILQLEQNWLSTPKRQQAEIAATIASLDIHVAPLDAPRSSGPASDDLVHS
jgi:hypothetical protein